MHLPLPGLPDGASTPAATHPQARDLRCGEGGPAGPGVRQVETKYLHLRQAVPLGHRIDGWRVCWLGGWDKQRVFFVVMLARVLVP
jgi:hypothetical protein